MAGRKKRKSDSECESSGDEARRKYLYRRMVMGQKIKLPSRLAKKLVGPDCAFHLYRGLHPDCGDETDS